jgi:type I restriction enzyme R subunit
VASGAPSIGKEQGIQDRIVALLTPEGAAWRYIPRTAMHEIRADRMNDVIVEPLLIPALQRFNPGLTDAQASEVAAYLRRITDEQEFQTALRDGVNIAFSAEEDSRDVWLLDPAGPAGNDYVVTTEFEVRTGGEREPRLDVVCLVNGIPLGLVEVKAGTHGWKQAARDFAGYWEDAPQLQVIGAVAVATNGSKFRVAPAGASGASKYAAWKTAWPHAEPDAGASELEVGRLGVLDPANLVDLAANFTVYETRNGKTARKLARYQQFRAANKIVRRVVDGVYDRGIIWHTQGSGKSLTMIFAARKLMRAGVNNPTVLLVIDRTDLDEQINGTLEACDFPGVKRATSRERLARMLSGDSRGVVVTTVQKFREEADVLSERENVIVFVDEAHRSQEGEYGIWMRDALPNAKLFAFTGTPLETGDRSTRRAFAPIIDSRYEDYLDAYGIQQAIEDGATLPIHYERGPVDWNVERDDLDEIFEREYGGLPPEQKARLQSDAARRAVVAKSPARVQEIARDVVRYVRDKLGPTGYKAQLVAVDRAAAAAYAAELEAYLAPEEFAVVYTADKDDTPELRRWYPSAQYKRLHPGSGLGDDRAAAELVEEFKDPETPLKLLVVCDMLLTGFDAPIEQVMFLDRGLRAHGLLQAIARTNRPFKNKPAGIVIDYWGVFSHLQAALAEFSPDDVAMAAIDLSDLRARFPVVVANTLALVAGIPTDEPEDRQMAWLVRHLRDEQRAAAFEASYQEVKSIYETLAPDPSLAAHLGDYKRLTLYHAWWVHGRREDADGFDLAEYRSHTHALVGEAITVERLRHDLPVYRVDERYLSLIDGKPMTPEEKAAEIEAALVHEIKLRGDDDPLAKTLSERLEELREEELAADQITQELLKKYEQLALDWAEEQQAHTKLGLTPRAYKLVALARAANPDASEEALVRIAGELDAALGRTASFPGWEQRDDVLRALRVEMLKALGSDEQTRPLATPAFVDDAINTVVADARRPQSA